MLIIWTWTSVYFANCNSNCQLPIAIQSAIQIAFELPQPVGCAHVVAICQSLVSSKFTELHTLLPVFSGVNVGLLIYHKFYGISSVICDKFMACLFFFHYSYGKTSHKIPKNCEQCAIMLSHASSLLSHPYPLSPPLSSLSTPSLSPTPPTPSNSLSAPIPIDES